MSNQRDLNAIQLAVAETARARKLHNNSMETRNNDGRLRILVEEVGEVADAIEDVEDARDKDPVHLAAARRHLTEEVVQVASAALRWAAALSVEDDAEQPAKLTCYRFITERANKVSFNPGMHLLFDRNVCGLSFDEAVVVCTREDVIEANFNHLMATLQSRRKHPTSRFMLEIV